MLKHLAESLENRILEGGEVSQDEALRLAQAGPAEVYDILPSAHRLARRFKGYDAELCGIVNAKSGRCAENCAFCAQSAHHRTDVAVYGLKTADEMVAAARASACDKADRFGIVTSGTCVSDPKEFEEIVEAVRRIRAEGGILPCASLGILPEQSLARLKAAGMTRYHHNLETSRSFFPNICSTHDYDDDVQTVAAARRVGLEVCSGGIFGLGETPAQRVEMAMTLRELGVDSVPLNFLVPVPGTPLENRPPLPPLETLLTVALYRFLLPRATIKVCAGRDRNLGDLASWIFFAGANGMMVGNYLTTAGRSVELDLAMLRALGYRPCAES